MFNLNMLNSSFMLRHRDPQNRPGDMLDLATSVPPAIHLQLEHEHESRRASSLLGDFRVCNAGDPRDKVFEILGLANNQRETSFRPDYSKSTAQTFIDFAVYLITKRKMLICDLLSQTHGQVSVLGMPSWVPNWSVVPNSGFLDRKLLQSHNRPR